MRRAATIAAAILGFSAEARADLRSFTETYEYSTVPQGKTAFELWHTQGRLTWDKDTAQALETVIELEHGLTDHWDVALYNVFSQTAGGGTVMAEPFRYSETKLETRYRLADRGVWPIDTLLYFEASKEFGQSVYGLEGKVIGARDLGPVTIAANAIVEIKLGKNAAETEPELAWAAGATYQVHPKLRLGAETWGALEEGKLALSAGPALSLALASNFWVATTAGFGFTDEADAFRVRAIIGIEL
ncbi:MAG TPA: hypothetical protein VN253_30105 [Kofleriaceae bacterium]|nr:hypothetical protein [Kofleriaceae bacterium]